MKASPILALTLTLLAAPFAQADRVIREVSENTAGRGYGALSGVMLGAAAGGPIGALAGAGAGFWFGGSLQQQLGLSGRAYEIEDAQGERRVVRSPNEQFIPGQHVRQQGSRISVQ